MVLINCRLARTNTHFSEPQFIIDCVHDGEIEMGYNFFRCAHERYNLRRKGLASSQVKRPMMFSLLMTVNRDLVGIITLSPPRTLIEAYFWSHQCTLRLTAPKIITFQIRLFKSFKQFWKRTWVRFLRDQGLLGNSLYLFFQCRSLMAVKNTNRDFITPLLCFLKGMQAVLSVVL